jgi:hypothetical protein
VARALVFAVVALVLAALPAGGSGARKVPKARWFDRVLITEYYPVPERWFEGRRVAATGLPGKHRVDWLYAWGGLATEGDGVGLDGRRYHVATVPGAGWLNENGRRTGPRGQGRWTRGRPVWRAGGWRAADGKVTFPFEAGGWFRGAGVRYVEPRGMEFGTGPSLPLRVWRSVAVDPGLVPLGSRVFLPAYCESLGRGWFDAEDTGSAVQGRHVDVYRPAPARPGGDTVRTEERMYVIPPKAKPPKQLPHC